MDRFSGIRLGSLGDKERMELYAMSRWALSSQGGSVGWEYLTQSRSLSPETIAKFRLGFCPFHVEHPFAGRIVIPIFDVHDDLLALSVRPVFKVLVMRDGRKRMASRLHDGGSSWECTDEHLRGFSIPKDDVFEMEEGDPKYWNESFPKSEHFFGMNMAKAAVIKHKFVVVVEGQMDVMSMWGRGIRNCVGVMGGELTPFHVWLLLRWTDQVVLVFDGDLAGRKNAEKAYSTLHSFSGGQKTLKIAAVGLPSDDSQNDPDAFLKANGAGAMRQALLTAMESAGMRPPKNYLREAA
jgi:DNA primase